ncbi:patatin-like phospholipase family protein [Marivirga sp. S37H4]|uniref:Patatin-like phospholipase family protein n=1 Tax=Marivirga aurantiaca TaxID=2802615 RepID=A0A934WZ42_9BACT|nr:patatin-like phospholipase family protein [Marivirga aurantiaca]MBK6265868.1 patatin-like phospholipase family protein [Marivirga aurantiaca]
MKQKVALVLGSGGARGVAHIGVIEALLENNFEITSIAGSSMGAVVGGIFAAGKLDLYKEWVTNFDKIDVFKLLDFTFSLQGFVRGERVFREMSKILGDIQIEEMNIPFSAVASNIRTQKEVIYNKGNLMDALRASCAIPTVMKPVYLKGEEIVDGGVLNPIPINFVSRTNGDILVAVDVNSNIPFIPPTPVTAVEVQENQKYNQFLEEFKLKMKNMWPYPTKDPSPTGRNNVKKFGYFDLLNRSIDLMQQRITTLQMEKQQPEMVVRVSRESCGTFEFYKSKSLVEAGKNAFESAFKDYQYALENNQ